MLYTLRATVELVVIICRSPSKALKPLMIFNQASLVLDQSWGEGGLIVSFSLGRASQS